MRVTDAELLKEVKLRMGVTGAFQDGVIGGYINDAKEFMIDAGVPQSVMETTKIIGAVARGASDLWNNGLNNGDFSPYFMKRVTQLCYHANAENDNTITEEIVDNLLGVNKNE